MVGFRSGLGGKGLVVAWLVRVIAGISMIALAACNGAGQLNGASPSSSSTSKVTGAKSSTGKFQIVDALPPPTTQSLDNNQRIAQNDLLEVKFFGVDNLDRSVRVDADGSISMPLVGSVRAHKLTVPELERNLEIAYNRTYLENAEVSVFVKESFGRQITMDGQFTKPGVYPITSTTTLLQAVSQAGGLTDLADNSKLYLYRKYGSQTRVAKYSVADIREGKKSNPQIYGGDVIVAFTSSSKVAMKNLRQAFGIATSATRIAAPL